jgi:hypothetical protein
MEYVLRVLKSFPTAVICLVLGFSATISSAQQAPDEVLTREAGAGAILAVSSVSGPASAIHNQTISLTYTVENQGAAASGPYKVGLYLSKDANIDPAEDRLLERVTFSTGLGAGKTRKTTSKVLVPINELSGKYYYGAVAGTSDKASSKQVTLPRYSLADGNETVRDHKTGLVWQQADDGKYRKWADAQKYCGNLVLGGQSDWRMPSLNELETIIDFSRSYPAIDPVFGCRLDNYWSSTAFNDAPSGAWDVLFNDGYVDVHSKTGFGFLVRCVRGGSW